MAPISSPSIKSSLNSHAAIIPVRAEVISTPTVASDSAGQSATRNELAPGAHTAVQQDHRQREVTHHIGEGIVIERNAADTVNACQHTDSEEDNQNRDAEARGERTQ